MTSRTLVRGTETVTEKHSCDILDPNNNERLTSHRAANGQRRARKQRSHKRSLDTTKSVWTSVQPYKWNNFQTYDSIQRWNVHTPGSMFSIRNIPKPTKMGGYGMNWFCKHHGVFRGSKCCATTFRRSLARSLLSFLSFSFTNTPKLEITISWTITFVFVLEVLLRQSTHSAL